MQEQRTRQRHRQNTEKERRRRRYASLMLGSETYGAYKGCDSDDTIQVRCIGARRGNLRILSQCGRMRTLGEVQGVISPHQNVHRGQSSLKNYSLIFFRYPHPRGKRAGVVHGGVRQSFKFGGECTVDTDKENVYCVRFSLVFFVFRYFRLFPRCFIFFVQDFVISGFVCQRFLLFYVRRVPLKLD